MKRSEFPQNFYWGVATASYQIEGSDLEDGKGPSIWTDFSHKKGTIIDGKNGDTACNSYNKYTEDLKLLSDLGINSYRFSISWSRIFPDGRGKVNQKGMDYYSKIIDSLLERNITPFVTLYHWDLPLTLQERINGWESRDMVGYFGDYSQFLFENFGDRVKKWITLNEPFCSSHVCYLFGELAPGIKDPKRSFAVAHNLLMSHGEAVKRFREAVSDGKIGLTNVSSWVEAGSESEEDKNAAFLSNQFINDWFFLTPKKGKYPQELFQLLEKFGVAPDISEEDMALISQPVDFWGINYYSRQRVKANAEKLFGVETLPPVLETTEMGWEIYPEGLQKFLEMAYFRYGKKPLYITENGMAEKDELLDGKIKDIKRVKYIMDHFESAKTAIKNGVDLRGYFLWTLMDNFEWAHGYTKRFGLVFCDFDDNQKRVPKESYFFFREFLKR